jgi:alkylation response protein AidB-like acyl-CoA dehydrogenase
MSSFELNFRPRGEDRLVLDATQRFASKLKAQMRAGESNGVSAELCQEYQALELTKLHWPSVLGGAEMGFRLKLQTLQLLARADAAALMVLEWPNWCGFAVAVHGPEGFGRGAACAVIDVDERLETTAQGLSGRWSYLPAALPNQLYLLCGTQLHRVSQAQLESSPPAGGALHAAGGCELTISGSTSIELGADAAAQISSHWRLFFAPLLTGLCRAAYEHARAYCLERETFGKKVAHHQAVAFILADMLLATESAELMLESVGAQLDAGAFDGNKVEAVEGAYLHAVEGALMVTNNAVQLLGAAGYVSDHPVEKWMREARALSVLCGGVDAARENAAQAMEAGE